jgi:hypothetical protein
MTPITDFDEIDLSGIDTGISSDKKLGETSLLIAQLCAGDTRFGAVKLNKLLFFADAVAFLKGLPPITKSEFMRQDEGPVPRRFVPVRDSLVESGRARVDVEPLPPPFKPRQKFIALAEPDHEVFNPGEAEILKDVVTRFWDWTGGQVSELSHTLPAWKIAVNGETIPMSALLLKDFCVSDKDQENANARIQSLPTK